jgi:hypothetical protein
VGRRIERTRYDADLAECRYEEADPSNRLVAATLEKRWNDAMQRVIELEAELANFQPQTMRVLTPEQKQQILQLGKDFPRLWKAPTTSTCDRKRILRMLIRDITVAKDTDPKLLHLQVRCQGSATDTIEVHRRPSRGLCQALRWRMLARDVALKNGGGEPALVPPPREGLIVGAPVSQNRASRVR